MPLTTFHIPVNDATSRVAAPRAVGAPVVVTAGTGALFGTSFPILLTVARGTPGTIVTELEATARTGDTLTISGPVEGASDVALLVGDLVECRPTALALAEVHDAVHALEAAAGGVAIGGAVSGGTATRIPFVGTGPVLADDDAFTYDPTAKKFTVGAPAGQRLEFTPENNGSMEFRRADDAGVLFFDWAFADAEDYRWRFYADRSNDVFTFKGDNYSFDPLVGFSMIPSGTARLQVGTAAGDRVGLLIKGSSSQTAPLGVLQGLSSTSARDLGYLDAGFAGGTTTDASYLGEIRLVVQDNGNNSGGNPGGRIVLKGVSNGTNADVVIPIANVRNAANDTAAAALTPAVPVGGIYRNGSVLMIRVS